MKKHDDILEVEKMLSSAEPSDKINNSKRCGANLYDLPRRFVYLFVTVTFYLPEVFFRARCPTELLLIVRARKS